MLALLLLGCDYFVSTINPDKPGENELGAVEQNLYDRRNLSHSSNRANKLYLRAFFPSKLSFIYGA